MKTWRKRVYDHLEKYKIESLKVKENGLFKEIEYGHILPKEYGLLNYMELVRNHESKFKKMKHMYWYHLNSSQTMCINFFQPLIEKGYISSFFNIVLGINKKIVNCEFEKVLEKGSTNFDFYAEDTDGNHYYFEIKYTEYSVSKKTSTDRVEETYKKFYLKDVESNPTFTDAKIGMNLFMNTHYQAYRTMVKAKGNDYSIFITMDGNDGVDKEINKALTDLNLNIKTAREKNIIILHWSEVVKKTLYFIGELEDKEELINHYIEFEKKS